MKIGDKVVLNPTSKYAEQSKSWGTIISESSLSNFKWTVKWQDYDDTLCYNDEDLLPCHEVGKFPFEAIREIAEDYELVKALKKWRGGPIEECPFHYTERERNCDGSSFVYPAGRGIFALL